MKLLHHSSGQLLEAVIELVEDEDWEIISKSGEFEFNWTLEKKYMVHKIRLTLEKEILGLVSIEDIPKELRLHIRLIENGISNRGKNKTYDFVAGCLIAFTCNLAFEKDYEGFVSLQPKTLLINHYKEKYGFNDMGMMLYIQLHQSEKLVKKFLHNEEI